MQNQTCKIRNKEWNAKEYHAQAAITELEEKRGAERACATNHRAAAMVNPSEPERANQLHTLTAWMALQSGSNCVQFDQANSGSLGHTKGY